MGARGTASCGGGILEDGGWACKGPTPHRRSPPPRSASSRHLDDSGRRAEMASGVKQTRLRLGGAAAWLAETGVGTAARRADRAVRIRHPGGDLAQVGEAAQRQQGLAV